MRADRPKQFLTLLGRTIVERSLELFLGMTEVTQVVVVVEEAFREPVFARYARGDGRIAFAEPGAERQDSVRNGLALVPETASLVCVHDAARPLVSRDCVRSCLRDAAEFGAAVVGVPCKATIKESDDGRFVLRTIERKRLWEVQTPQVVRPALLRRGFEKVDRDGLQVTDDVSVVEQLGDATYSRRVKITPGEYENIKITTPDDMLVAEQILVARGGGDGSDDAD